MTALAAASAPATTPMPVVAAQWRNSLLGKTWHLGTGPTAPKGNYVSVNRESYLPNLVGHGTSNAPRWDIAGTELADSSVAPEVERYRSAIAALPDHFVANVAEHERFAGPRIGEMFIQLDAGVGAERVMRIDQHAASGALREVVDAVHALAGVTRHFVR